MNHKRLMSFLMATSFLFGYHFSAKASDELEVTHFNTFLGGNEMIAFAPKTSDGITSTDTDNSDTELPISFDLREQNLISSVKSQGSYGICWALTATSLMETELISAHPDIDLSEWQLAYYTYSKKFGFPLPDTSPDPEDAFSMGGNYFFLNAILLNWVSPALESDYPFEKTANLDPDLDIEAVQQQSAYHMKNSYYIEYDPESSDFENQLRQVKEIVHNGHAVAMNYYNASAHYSGIKGNQNFYNPLGNTQGTNYHAITIVGWDDNYSADNFKTVPDRDGAWLCKNSWGESWGNDGYFWMSYAEKSCIQPYYLEMEEKNVHHHQFYYDEYGWNSSFTISNNSTSSYMANIFTAEEDTLLTSARFATGVENENYEVQVYTNLRSKSRPTSGTSSAGIAKGKTGLCGYYTVDLETPVRIKAGETFSIVVKLSGSVGRHVTCESYVGTTTELPDGTGTFTKNINEEQLMENFAKNQSFYSANGTTWSDIYSAGEIEETYTVGNATVTTRTILGNVCVRGLTQLMGDVNLDGVINATDAGEVLIYSAKIGSGEIPENDIQWISRADMDNGGSLNASDAANILQIAAKLGAGE